MPGDEPSTTPEPETVATNVLELATAHTHAAVTVVVAPTQTVGEVTASTGVGLTVSVAVEKQPVGSLYVIVAVPGAGVADMPPAMPVVEPIVPIAVLLLLQVPSGAVFVSVVVAPWHTANTPPMAGGLELTVIVAVAMQPEPGSV